MSLLFFSSIYGMSTVHYPLQKDSGKKKTSDDRNTNEIKKVVYLKLALH